MMEDFSGLALPPLFGGHILEAELEPGGVELGPGEVMIWSCKQQHKSRIWSYILYVTKHSSEERPSWMNIQVQLVGMEASWSTRGRYEVNGSD